MKTIAQNANDFQSIRTMDKGNCIYVDKSDFFYRLITAPGENLFFIARPRRFGKSLMITTFKYIFEGRRELFKGLKIDQTDYDWKVHPVIHLDFSRCSARTYDEFMRDLPSVMRTAIENSGGAYDETLTPSVNFMNAIEWHFKRGTPCVVLIDEYDDPVAQALADPREAELVRSSLSLIYGKVKGMTHMIRFLMMTGVSKFTKMSVFSVLSNLTDISMRAEYAEMLGYTEEELETYFSEHMVAHAKVMNLSQPAYRAELKRWFNGYRFSPDNSVTVFNPVSVGLTFAELRNEFRGTWTATGRPSMLMNFIKREGLIAIDYENMSRVKESMFDVSDLRNLRPIAMLYQAGYLTIKDYNPKTGNYTLAVPDEEVRRDLALLMASQAARQSEDWVGEAGDDLLEGLFDSFFARLKSLFAALPYGSTENSVHEMSYERALVVLLNACRFQVIPESTTATGRADLIAVHPLGIYIFEFKRDASAAVALQQIKDRDYAAPYRAKGLPIWGLGLNFDSKTRALESYLVERLG